MLLVAKLSSLFCRAPMKGLFFGQICVPQRFLIPVENHTNAEPEYRSSQLACHLWRERESVGSHRHQCTTPTTFVSFSPVCQQPGCERVQNLAVCAWTKGAFLADKEMDKASCSKCLDWPGSVHCCVCCTHRLQPPEADVQATSLNLSVICMGHD